MDEERAVAIFGRKREASEENPAVGNENPEGATPSSEPTESAPQEETPLSREGSRLVVGSNVRLSGSEISDCDTVIVEGRVEATVDGRVMQITETGMFTGTVAIDMAEIRGQYNGELTVRKRLTVCGTGRVKGKIRYGTLVVEEGGELSGDVDSLNTPSSGAARTPTVSSPPPSAAVTVTKPDKPDIPDFLSRGTG